MDFSQSTQATCWMFDSESLLQCKQEATRVQSLTQNYCTGRVTVRKHACGFQQRKNGAHEETPTNPLQTPIDTGLPASMATIDQDILVHFHSHQIQRLVGPNAIFPALRRSASVLSTAIMLFRRFYLSNSVIDFHPRKIAAASALLAVKVDCERNLEVAILSHATSVVNHKAHKATLCREELRAVSVDEIEEAERILLAGLDYRLRCHHPYGAIRVLASEIVGSISDRMADYKTNCSDSFNGYVSRSPRGINDLRAESYRLDTLCERALAVAQAALVYSDVSFLFPPGKIAFAAVTIALEGKTFGRCLGPTMKNYLRMRFPHKGVEELDGFERDVVDIIQNIETCPGIDMMKFYAPFQRRFPNFAQQKASQIRRVFSVAAYFRDMVATKQAMAVMQSCSYSQKRRRDEEHYICSYPMRFKAARVTPNHTPYFP